MEQVLVVLEPDPEDHGSWTEVQGRRVRPETIYVTAHKGKAPTNRYDFPKGGDPNGKAHVLVELGSHAAGTDTDRDGLFIPVVDGESSDKILWGVRHRRYIWTRYSPEYMDHGNAVFFCYGEESFEGEGGYVRCMPSGCFSYRLTPAEKLYCHFKQLALTNQEKEQEELGSPWREELWASSPTQPSTFGSTTSSDKAALALIRGSPLRQLSYFLLGWIDDFRRKGG